MLIRPGEPTATSWDHGNGRNALRDHLTDEGSIPSSSTTGDSKNSAVSLVEISRVLRALMPFSRSDPCSTADTCIAAVGLGVIRHAADPKTQPTVTESWQPTHPLLCLQMASLFADGVGVDPHSRRCSDTFFVTSLLRPAGGGEAPSGGRQQACPRRRRCGHHHCRSVAQL